MARKSKKEKKPTFFQILFNGFNTEHLIVPRKFLTHILKELSERAILKPKGSSDCPWTVRVSKTTKGAVRFNGGWQAFLKDNSLGHGDFLVFTYDGKMQFSVDIFDNPACERIDDKIWSSSKCPFSTSSSSEDSVQSPSSSKSSEFDENTEEEEDEEEDTCKDSDATCKDNISKDSDDRQDGDNHAHQATKPPVQ